MKRLYLLLIFIFLIPGNYLAGNEDQSGEQSLGFSYIDMDIRTSSLRELAAWARELGLSEGGTREDLAARLRAYYGIPFTSSTDHSGQRIITIESASTTEYFTIDEVDEEYARFTGDVVLSLRDGNSIHRIKAWEVLFNRSRNVLSASGGVEYIREEGDTVETFRGESIVVNLDNWASVFMDGASERSSQGAGSAYRFSGTIISRNADGATVLTDAVISNPANEDALWSLNARRLWLLPGNDWAILHAVLRVGNIPVLYLPFFYYPTDEIVFHPVLGTRPREGTFLQTTTYILGRPTAATISENSITRIFGNAEDHSDRRLEGIFLRSTGERSVSPSNTRLSLMFDAYTNLGLYLGADLTLPSQGIMNRMSLSAGLGLTRDIYNMGSGYTPFRDLDGVSNWNSGLLFSMEVPFRFHFDLTGGLSLGRGSFNWDVSFYSDPFVRRDFTSNRSEVLDWLAMIREGSTNVSSGSSGDSGLSSFDWRLYGSYNFQLTSLSPYISSLSISNYSTSLTFNRRNLSSQPGAVIPNPGQAFFFPNRLSIFSASAAMSGNLYRTSTSPVSGTAPAAGQTPGESILPGTPISPWDSAADTQSVGRPVEIIEGAVEPILTPPVLTQRFTLPVSGGPSITIGYNLSPTTASDLNFRSSQSNWSVPEDINWSEVSTVLYRLRADGNINININQTGGNLYSASLRLSGTGSYQDYWYLNSESEEFAGAGGTPSDALIKAAWDRIHRDTYFTTSYNLSSTFRPFPQTSIWNASSLTYNLAGLLGRTTVDTSGSSPVWEWNYGEFSKTDINTHRLGASFSANYMGNTQTLTINTVLPPNDTAVTATASLRYWIMTTSISGGIRHPLDGDLRTIDQLTLRAGFNIGPSRTFSQNIVYNPEIGEFTTFTSNLVLGSFSANFSASYARPYEFVENATGGNIWQLMPDSIFAARNLNFNYSYNFTRSNLWDNRLTYGFNFSTGLLFDLQRYTNSSLNFNMGIRVNINNFLGLSFSATSANNVMFQYFQNLPFFNLPEQLYPGQETNIFVDLFNSFRFGREDLRRKSGFKLRSMSMTLTHNLGDWNANLTITSSPFLDQSYSPPVYRFTSEISFIIQWVPINEIRTEINRTRDGITIN